MKGPGKEIKARYDELCGLISRYNHHYYTLHSPLVSDGEYDVLMEELASIEKKHPTLKRADSPTQRVGGEAAATFSKVAHDPPMQSLGNIFSAQELEEFDARCRKGLGSSEGLAYSGELKFDGLAVEVVYRGGAMVQGSTRGSGAVGEDVTANLSTIQALPRRLGGPGAPGYLSVRGEVYLTHGEFERLNAERERDGEPPFANPRNAAAGSLRQLDPAVTAGRKLDVAFYGVGKVDGGMEVRDQKGLFEMLDRYGIPRSPHCVTGTLDEIRDFYEHWYEARHTLEFDIDGIVVKVSDFSMRDELGTTSKAPRWAVAWKFPSAEAVTVVESVDYQLGRTGLVTPVANLKPINIGGVIVKRATLHNFREVERLGVRIGDIVTVKRAGDVIPKIVAVVGSDGEAGGDILPPELCPSCGSKLQREEIFLRCVNGSCGAVKMEKLRFFVSKDGMDMEFMGPELVNRLVQAGIVRDAADFFAVDRDRLLTLDRMGEKLADKILETITARKRVPLSHFLKSMGIKNVGEHMASVIAAKAVSLERLGTMSVDELKEIHEVGEQVASSVFAFMHDPATVSLFGKLKKNGLVVEDERNAAVPHELFSGKTFVFTGTLTRHTRKECETMVAERGGRTARSVSARTNLVVAGDAAGSKLDRARELGIAVLTEEEFLAMLEE